MDIKTITIKDETGRLIYKFSCKKNGEVEEIKIDFIKNWEIDIRGERNKKLIF